MPSSPTTHHDLSTAAAAAAATSSSSQHHHKLPHNNVDNDNENNARIMISDRAFVRQLMQAALQGDGRLLESVATNYARQHDLSLPHVLSSCRDGQKRTVLHFACQSTTTTATTADDNDDIVHVILRLVSSSSSSSDTTTNTPFKNDPDDHPSEEHHTTTATTNSARRRLLRGKDHHGGLTPLMLACQNPVHAESFASTLLLQGDGQLALARSKVGATALHYAAGTLTTTPHLIRMVYDQAKVALETCSLQGGTPLHWAAAAATTTSSSSSTESSSSNNTTDAPINPNSTLILQTLLELGANINARNEQGLTPLVICMAAGKDEAATFLIQQQQQQEPRCEVDMVLPDQNNLVHMAVHLNLQHTLAALLKRIRESTTTTTTTATTSLSHLLTARNDQGQTPLDVACEEGHVECIRLLLADFPEEEEEEEASQEAALHYWEEWKQQQQQQQQQQGEKAVMETKTNVSSTTTTIEPPLPSSTEHDGDNALSPQEEEWKQQALQIMQTHPSTDSTSPKVQEAALSWKQKGNQAFGNKDWNKALECYSKAIECMPTEATLYSNRSATYLALVVSHHETAATSSSSSSAGSDPQQQQHEDEEEELKYQVGHTTQDYATLALQDAIWTIALRPDWPKSWYRCAMARLQLERFEDAAMAAWQGLQLDQSNHELQTLLRTCVERGRQQQQQQKEGSNDDAAKK
jgi:ankyrin repeat protein